MQSRNYNVLFQSFDDDDEVQEVKEEVKGPIPGTSGFGGFEGGPDDFGGGAEGGGYMDQDMSFDDGMGGSDTGAKGKLMMITHYAHKYISR